MSDTRWVQHVSGQGEKWEITDDRRTCNETPTHPSWIVVGKDISTHDLPKSEYRLCPPPEVWKDVTEFVQESATPGNFEYRKDKHDWARNVLGVAILDGYRLRKATVNLVGPDYPNGCQKSVAFIVERKVSS